MRLFEGMVLATLALTLIGSLFVGNKRPRWMCVLSGVVSLLVVIHLLVERHRWQMVPGYALVVLLLALSVFHLRWASHTEPASRSRGSLRLAGVILGLSCLVVSVALLIIFPMFRFPEPTGPYAVGATRLHLVDETRSETFTADPDDHRELVLQVWYPAEAGAGAEPVPYWEGVPLFFNHLRLVRTHSFRGVPVASASSPFPVLIFSHGYLLGYVSQNTAQMEELASHGYVVFSIAHPYEALAVTFLDGRRALFSEGRLCALVEAWLTGSGAAPLMEESLRIWTDDTIFVMDELESMTADEGMFAGKLDLSRLGVFGMSFGGATATQVCLVDRRCRAGINLDGALWGDDLPEGGAVQRPFMVIYDEATEGMNDDMYEGVDGPAYRITIKGSAHGDFGDMTLMSPFLKRVGGVLGPIDGYRMVSIINDYTLAFFDKHLRGEDVPLLDGSPLDYPEVAFESHSH